MATKSIITGVVSRRRHGSTSTLPLVLLVLLWMLLLSSSSWFCEGKRVVSHLPGYDGELPFHLETGYVDVDELAGVRLFYYFIRSERRRHAADGDDPVVLWLTGGPGCSALSGLVYEVGPLTFDFAGGYGDGGLPRLLHKPDAWTAVSNVIFLDSPVGTGFSYSDTAEGFISSDTVAVRQILVFLTKWFADEHPELLPNPLYVAGDSYSGMILPSLASQIATFIEEGSSPLNLKGYLVGNPVTDGTFDNPSKIPFAHGMGLISDEMYQAYKTSCSVQDDDQVSSSSSSQQSIQCNNTLDVIDECVKGIYPNHILEPYCTFASPHKQKQSIRLLYSGQDHLQLSRISSECRTEEYKMSGTWANNEAVREALGIHKGTVPFWQRCNYDILYSKNIPSSVKYHLVTTRGYRGLIYSGDHDMVIPFIGTQDWIRSLNFSVVDDWRPWIVDGQVAGYTRSYSNNFTFATVKGGGHTAPEYMPRQCFAMFSRWLAGDQL